MPTPVGKTALKRAIVLAVALVGVVGLTFAGSWIFRDVRQQVSLLAGANSDAAQWTLAQGDVELLAFLVEARSAQMGEATLRDVRRRFDVFYSRISLLENSPTYEDVRSTPEAFAVRPELLRFLTEVAAIMDGPEDGLRNRLPEIIRRVETIRPKMRTAALAGQSLLSKQSDQRRERAADALLRVATLAAVMLVALLMMVAALTQLVRQTRQRAREQARTRARLQAIVSTSLDAILVVDRHGRVRDYNGAAETLFGHPRAMAIGLPASSMLDCPSGTQACEMGMPLPGSVLTRVNGVRRNGTRFPAECSVAESVSDDGPIRVVFLRDISARLAAETALVEARDRALAGEKAKADMLAVMSHEMRTPLNGMLGTVELLMDGKLTPRQREYLGIVRKSGLILLRHVNDVLDISRLDSGRMSLTVEAFDGNAVLREVADTVRPTAEANGNRILLGGLDPLLDNVEGDAQKIRQILLNLVGNAAKFTHDGEITLSASRDEDGMAEFVVADTGIGISETDQGRIFDDFVTLDSSYGRRAEGTGLGLGIARRMAQAMGGTITLSSVQGQGSEFRLRVPVTDGKPVVAPAPVAKPAATLGPLRVLVVEDNEINRFVVRTMLEGDGHTVNEAFNGAEGVVKAGEAGYDLILMDISMPEMDGTEATRAIRAGDGPSKNVPIIALTAHALPSDLERFAAAGMTATLTKPLARTALRDLLATLMTTPVAPDAPDEAQMTNSAPTPHLPHGAIDSNQANSLIEGLGRDVFAGLLDRYVAETDAGLADLEVAVNRGEDPMTLAAMAHKLAGTAAMFGAIGLRGSLVAVEEAAKTGAPERIPGHARAARAVWPATRAALTQL